MSAHSDTEQRQGALASRTRRQVLAQLTEAPHPLDAATVAEHFGIHVTTARFHLEQLENAGLVERTLQRAGQRGRPRVMFSAVPTAPIEDALRQLNSVLVDALTHDSDGGRARARDAGERWSTAYRDQPDDGADDTSPLLRIFERLGFEPELRDAGELRDASTTGGGPVLDSDAAADGDSTGHNRIIALRGCPFRDAAAEHPEIVCSVHRGLLEGTIGRLGHDSREATLHPFVEPELCLVQLRGALAAG